jgi:hypothetical protein
MNNLADSVLDYFWFLNFSEEDEADPDVTVKLMEELVHSIETNFSETEKSALMDAARGRLSSWLREPDEYGYTPRGRLTSEQRAFLVQLAAGQFAGDDDEDDEDDEDE